ncbi:MAG: SDR family NAD(P)-dependent oxidoreductase [Alphaproteobacteria bacterium]|nr:SDR family NAD(P)-dependent oxidoreductase [Alphaproteobacteria bacterium]
MTSLAGESQEVRQLAGAAKPLPRVVLVTGGTEGVGALISRRMKDDGHIVAATYRNERQAAAWQDAMEKENRLFFIYPNDVKSLPACRRLAARIAQDIGAVDVLVNAAGRGFGRGREYDSAFGITCAVMDGMLDKGFGRIVNVSFMSDLEKNGAESVHALTRELFPEVSQRGIAVNTVSPGEATPLPGVFRKPGDVAEIVSLLAADEAGLVSGRDVPAAEYRR